MSVSEVPAQQARQDGRGEAPAEPVQPGSAGASPSRSLLKDLRNGHLASSSPVLRGPKFLPLPRYSGGEGRGEGV
jgi:hypothetical protein